MDEHIDFVSAIVISDDGKLIIAGSNDNPVGRWDARNGKVIGKPMEHSQEFADIAISTDGCLILSGHDDSSITRWKAETDEKIGHPIKAAGWPGDLVISNNGAIIVCEANQNDFEQQWQTATGELIGERMK